MIYLILEPTVSDGCRGRDVPEYTETARIDVLVNLRECPIIDLAINDDIDVRADT